MTKKLKRPLAFLSAFVMVMALLLYFPSGTFSNIDWGIKASAETITPTKPSTDDKGVYQIGTEAELYWFAGLVNGTLTDGTGKNTAANAVLTADIVVNTGGVANCNGKKQSGWVDWTPIGNSYSNSSTGNFDGQGHTVSGLYFNNSSNNYVGLFGYVGTGGSVSNVGIVDSYFNGNQIVGGVCGDNNGGKITNCYNTSTVITTYDGAYVGGVCGYNDEGTITSCYNTGAVSGMSDDPYVGGVCGMNSGYIKNCYNTGSVSKTYDSVDCMVGGVCGNNWGNIENCYITGTVSANVGGGINNSIGGVCGENSGTVKNCYYDRTKCAIGGIYSTDVTGQAEGKTTSDFSNGTVCELVGFHSLQNDITCALCGGYEPAVLNNGKYEISNAGQLYWFAGLVNGTLTDGTAQNQSANAVLTADIVVNTGDVANCNGTKQTGWVDWTPIGWYINDKNKMPYTGTFDGQNHTVSGLYFNNSDNSSTFYVGLFGCVGTGGIISNVSVDNSCFYVQETGGGVCGENRGIIQNCNNTGTVHSFWFNAGGVSGRNYGTIQNCRNFGKVEGTADQSGGVCGRNDEGIIQNCFNIGTVITSREDVNTGGICGSNEASIINCANACAVSGDGRVGGVCGYNTGTITNCFNTGGVSATGKVGGVCGYINNYSKNAKITNCYYDNVAYTGDAFGYTDSGATITNVSGKSTDKFDNGEVAYLLNDSTSTDTSVWHQNIDNGATKDSIPVLDASHGTVYQCTTCTAVYSNTQKEAAHSFISNSETQHICENCGVTQAHTIDYTAVEHSISASCSVCQHDFGKVTLKAPAELTYDGNAKAATVDGAITAAGYIAPTISYKKGNEAFNGTPTDAGAYTASITIGDKTVSVDYTIGKAAVNEINITGITAPKAGEALDTEAVTSDTGYTLSDVTWSPSGSTAGYNQEYQVSVKVTPTANYQFASGVTAKINAKEATVVNNENGTYTVSYTFSATDKKTLTLTLDNDTKTYNGSVQTISPATKPNDYNGVITYEYYINDAYTDKTTAENSGAKSEGGAPKNAGTYYVKAKAPENGIYAEATANATYVINKADVRAITITGIDIPAAGTALDTTAETSDAGYTLGAVTWKLGDEAVNGNAGYNKAYTASVVVTPTANYKFAENVKATINAKEATVVNNEGGTYTVSYIFGATVKKVPTITLESDTAPHIYNGSVQGIATVAKVEAGNSGKVSYKYYIDEECKNETTSENGATENGGAPKNAGTYYVKATVEANDIYAEATSNAATYTIGQATLTVVGAKAENRVYDPASKNVTITAVTLNGICDNDDVSVDVTNLTGTISSTNAGVYTEVTLMGTLTLTGTAAGNYTLTQPTEAVSTNVTIEKADNVPNTPTNLTGCIGAKLSTVSLESYPNWSWDEPDTTLHALNVGDTFPAKASYNGSDKDNYKNVTNVGLTVTLNAHPYSQDGFCTECGAYQPAVPNSDGVYEIGNAGQLYWFADKVNNDNKNFGNANAVLTGNIVVNENVLDTDGKPNEGPFEEWTPIGNTSNPYTGTFDGNGYTVGGLYFDDPNASDVGLFGCNNGTIQNVNVNDSYFNAGSDVGGVCGSNGDNGTITNCDNAGTVSGTTNVGGVCGENNSGSITSSDNTGNVSTSGDNASVGGVCGNNNGGTITSSNNTGNVSTSGNNASVGGVCGSNTSNGTITGCKNEGEVTTEGADSSAGGVCGSNTSKGEITNSDNTGKVSGTTNAGGVCGSNTDSGKINDCSNKGEVTGTGEGSSAGGVCGENNSGTIENSNNTGSISGTTNAGGVCGNNNSGSITSSDNTGNVSTSGDNASSGGVCGSNTNSGEINDCSNGGEVTGTGASSSAGGICGENSSSSITNSDNTGKVSGTNNAGGVCGQALITQATSAQVVTMLLSVVCVDLILLTAR